MAIPFYVSPPPPGSTDEQRLEYNRMLKKEFGGCDAQKPQEGDLQTKLVFTWWPKKVCGKWIWLRNYQILQEYRTKDRIIDTGLVILSVHCGGWDTISKRI